MLSINVSLHYSFPLEPTNSHQMASSSSNNSQSPTVISEKMKLNQAMQARLPSLKPALTHIRSGPDYEQRWVATYTITWPNGEWRPFQGTECSTKDAATESAAATTRSWVEANYQVISTLSDTLVLEVELTYSNSSSINLRGLVTGPRFFRILLLIRCHNL
jgi:hypothetical protein